MDSLRVLMTGTGAPGFPSIYNCLRNNGERELYIVGVDMNPMAAFRGKVDKFYQVPAASSPDFIDSLLEICKKEKIDVLISIVTRELELFALSKERFEAIGTKLSVMDYEPLHIANNKGLLLNAMKNAGISTPEFCVVNTPEELKKAIFALGYPQNPVVVKPTFGNGSRGVRILDTSKSRYDRLFNDKPNSQYLTIEELMSIIQEKNAIPEMMVMEYLPNEDVSVDVLADHGRVIYSSSREGKVVSSIMVSSEVKIDYEAVALAKKIVALLNLDGNIGFDMKKDKNGVPQLMEINPRLPAGVAVETVAGINFPYLRIKQLLNEELPECKITEGYQMQIYNKEILFNPYGEIVNWDIE